MNPENLYPELKDMKPGEIFVEYARITKNDKITMIPVKKIILKDGRDDFVRELKRIIDYEIVELMTISK
jgi:hypothetical protein